MSAGLVPDAAADDTAAHARSLRPHALYVAAVVGLALLYYGSAKIGYALDFAGPVAAIVWLPVGVGISFLYLAGLSFWPGIVLGDLLANDYSALPLGSAFGQTFGNVLEVIAASVLLRRLVRGGSPLDNVGALGRMLIALAAGTTVSATVGSIALRLGGVIAGGDVPHIWRTWWLGDFSGALIVVPLAIAWFRPGRHWGWRGTRLEGVLVVAAVAGLTELAFRGATPLTYLVFPALIWAALRFGPRGATLSVAVAAGLTMWDTTHVGGPFMFESITTTVLATQLYLAVAAVSALSLAAVVTERERIAQRLAASRVRLVEAGDVQRRRLEHDLHDGAQQRLTALAVRLDRASDDANADPSDASRLLREATVEVALAIEELRQLARGLLPAVLSQLGLASAVTEVARRSVVPITLAALPSARVDPTAESTAYFVFAEAIANAQKHAYAESITVRIVIVGGELRVDVRDDGIGGADESAGLGLQGLRDRVEAVGGRFSVESAPRRGTRVNAVIPSGSLAPAAGR